MAAGRPLKYNTVEEMQKKINEYFDSRKAPLLDKQGRPVTDENEEIVMVDIKPCTITGLALALGFNSRQSLLNYQDKEEFLDAIMRAKSRVEEYAESRLFDKDGANGAKFSLANNFKDWKDKSEVDLGNKDNKPFEVRNLSDAELEQKLAELGYKKV